MDLFPEIEPFRTHRLPVSSVHEIYVEQCGSPDGKPIVFLHGGPGGGIAPLFRRYFDPKVWNVVLFDQRGCGKSTPFSNLTENTTWDLVSDMETIREHLGIDSWTVFGGSWGSTLALAYAETHPERVAGLLLRGIFLGTKQEIDWLYQCGASRLFPEAWDDYLAPIPQGERGDLLGAYHKRLTSEDPRTRAQAAKAWSTWEARTSKLIPDPEMIEHFASDEFADAFARIECHYFLNRCFFKTDDYLLANAHKLQGIPGVIVHGRYDVVCTVDHAWELKKRWPDAELHIAGTSGHAITEPEIAKLLVEHTAKFGAM